MELEEEQEEDETKQPNEEGERQVAIQNIVQDMDQDTRQLFYDAIQKDFQ